MKRHYSKVLVGVLLCAAWGSTAMAQSKVTFTGEVYNNTCAATINNSSSATVNLSPVSTSALSSIGSMSLPQFFDIALTGCNAFNGHTVKAYFYQTNAVAGRLVKDTGDSNPGAGWSYQLTDATGNNYFDVGITSTVVPSNVATSTSVSSGSGTLTYGVRYVRTGSLTPGKMKATATYVIYSS